MTRILLELATRRLHSIDDGDLKNTVIVTRGWLDDPPEFCSTIELESGEVWALPREFLANREVRDEEIHSLLRSADIDGLLAVTPLHTSGHPLPISGNLVAPSWVSVNLDGHCDSHCVFCYTELIRRKPGLSQREVEWALERGREAGASAVVFTGGEPTLRKDLEMAIEMAHRLGFAEIGIQTNGHRLADESYLDTLRAAGLGNVLLSLHGPVASLHDQLAGHAGSFSQACDALINLSRTGLSVTVNFVVCLSNGPSAAAMVDLIARLHHRASLRFSFLIIEGAVQDCTERITPTLREFVEWVGEAVARGAATNVCVEAANVPPCISAALGLPSSYELAQRRSLMNVSPLYSVRARRGELDVKLSACDGCEAYARCGGLQMAYLAHVPDAAAHIRPIRKLHDQT